MSEIFELAVVVSLAAVLGVVARLLKQPILLAYLAAGLLLGYFGFLKGDNGTFRLLSDLGIMFLLFLVGLEINYTSLRLVGKPSLIIGLGQIIFTFVFGFLIAVWLGFNWLYSAYISIALTFSSTIIIVKLLSDKKDLHSLYGKISIGSMLVQDFVAIAILVVLAGLQKSGVIEPLTVFLTVIKGVLLFGIILLLGRKVFPKIFNSFGHSHELLFIISLAWVLSLAVLVKNIGFSIEIAGFLAGLALANSSERFQIASRIRPLRDFFILLFFVLLGSSITLSSFSGIGLSVLLFSLFVLIGNPLIVLVIMGFMGYRKRTSFLTGLTVAQISEFSLVLAALGLKLGHINEAAVTLITGVGIITIALSAYLIVHGNRLFRFFAPVLSVFERASLREISSSEGIIGKPIILIGYHRTGQSIAYSLPKNDLLVIDFDPEIGKLLAQHGIPYISGDITDEAVQEQAGLTQAKLVISTSPDFSDNAALLGEKKKNSYGSIMVVRAEEEQDAKQLYALGADYVLLPHISSGQQLGKLIAADPTLKILEQLKKHDTLLMAQTARQ